MEQLETMIFRAQSDDGLFERLMNDREIRSYLRDLGDGGWEIKSSTTNQVRGGHWVLLMWLQRPRGAAPSASALPASVSDDVAVSIPGYL